MKQKKSSEERSIVKEQPKKEVDLNQYAGDEEDHNIPKEETEHYQQDLERGKPADIKKENE